MRFLVQRVENARVEVDKDTVGKIDRGFLVFLGISKDDDEIISDFMVKKLLSLRIFEDEKGKTNLSLADVCGSLLLVSQFTLYADCKKGNRPSFNNAGEYNRAKSIYEYIVEKCKEEGYTVKTGVFGADMKISLLNDGPFTILLDSKELL